MQLTLFYRSLSLFALSFALVFAHSLSLLLLSLFWLCVFIYCRLDFVVSCILLIHRSVIISFPIQLPIVPIQVKESFQFPKENVYNDVKCSQYGTSTKSTWNVFFSSSSSPICGDTKTLLLRYP